MTHSKTSKTPARKHNRKNAIMALFLVAALLVTGAFAYLTDKDSATNVFTVGDVAIDLTEPSWDEENGKDMWAGKIIDKDPQIENTGDNDAFIYAMVTVPKADGLVVFDETKGTATVDDYQLFTYDLNAPIADPATNGWTLIDSKEDDNDANNYYLYAYNTALAPGNTTVPVFNKITFANIVTNNNENDPVGNPFIDPVTKVKKELNVNIDAYAIQSNFGNGSVDREPADVWNLYKNQNGWTFPSVAAPLPEGMTKLDFVAESGEVVHTEVAAAGTPVEMYFEPSLAKDGYTFDWTDESTGEVAYSGMPMPAEDTTLAATYTETGYGTETSDFIEYVLCSDSSGTISAVVAGLDETHENYPTSNFSLVIPAQINVTISETGAVSLSRGTYTGNVSPHLDGKTDLLTRVNDPLSVLGEGTHTLPVMYIRDYAFLDNTNVENLVIPDSVKTIGRYLFCKTATSEPPVLNSIVLAYGTHEIQNSFYRCTSLSEINKIPSSVTEIGSNAFQNTSIESITIPSSVITIEQRAFANCSNLTSLSLPSTLKTIGSGLVYNTPLYSNSENWYNNCLYIDNYLLAKETSNSAVTIKSTTLGIAENVLSQASSITLEEGCNYILDENGVLYNKDMTRLIYAPASLTTYTIPHTVTEIYGYAFYDCSSLTDVYYIGTEEEWNSVAIGRNNTNLTSAALHYN